jgi:hypothetical protein
VPYVKKGFRRNNYEVTEEHFKIAAENGLERWLVLKRVRDLFWDVDRAVTEPRITRGKRWKGIDQDHQ